MVTQTTIKKALFCCKAKVRAALRTQTQTGRYACTIYDSTFKLIWLLIIMSKKGKAKEIRITIIKSENYTKYNMIFT